METISFRPSKKVSSEFEKLLQKGKAAKSELARELFELGIESWRKKKALKAFGDGKVSFLSAAEQAGLSAYEFLELLKETKTAFIHITEPELRQELELAGS
ncbi:UPF0175 family protein [Candidatus Micrarchaeota archaeon]|nr:UPF0175 family protein [Candidatus Micrarchaeota archaeon]